MKISAIKKSAPQLRDFETRLECIIDYSDGHSEVIWTEIAGPHAAAVTDDVDPWIVMLLPLAVTLGEPIETSYAIDSTLLSNLNSLQRVWCSWYPTLSPIEINANITNRFAYPEKINRSSASFFSGGVDSFHILARCTGPNRVSEVNGIITVWGFDIPLSKPDEFDQVKKSCDDVAESLNIEPNVVATNMRTSRFAKADWGGLSHGCALSSIALLFRRIYSNVLIGSTHQIPDFQPWGSTVITDPLCSSSVCQIIHFGATETRVQKTKALIDFAPAMQHLRVCWQEQAAGNCGKCSKCIRTMSTLNLFGPLDRFKTFQGAQFSLDMLAKVALRSANDEAFISEIAKEAAAIGDTNTAAAANAAVRRYTFERSGKRVLALLPRPFRRVIHRLPYFWRFAR